MNKKVIELTDGNFKDVVNGGKLALVDFWATWCMPCKMLAPIIDGLAEEIGDEINVCKLDVDQAEDTAMSFKIMSVPTLIIFKDGEPVERMTGMRTKEQIITALDKHKI